MLRRNCLRIEETLERSIDVKERRERRCSRYWIMLRKGKDTGN
jgi:hypothetical protein